MAEETLTELQERARVDYGITNAEDMSEEQLRDEIKAIDDQAKTADEEPKTGEGSESDEDEEETPVKTRKELEAEARELSIEKPGSKSLYPTNQSLQDAIDAANGNQDTGAGDDEDEEDDE